MVCPITKKIIHRKELIGEALKRKGALFVFSAMETGKGQLFVRENMLVYSRREDLKVIVKTRNQLALSRVIDSYLQSLAPYIGALCSCKRGQL